MVLCPQRNQAIDDKLISWCRKEEKRKEESMAGKNVRAKATYSYGFPQI